MSSYYPDPVAEIDTAPRLYDALRDITQPDGTLLVAAGDVFGVTVRAAVDRLVNGRAGHYYRPHERDIPFDGSLGGADMSAVDAARGVPFGEWAEMHGDQLCQFEEE
jgi:hypothetical protein